ncbi:MAG: hypothetical protein ACRDKB_13300 [Actinomycetota bacterium]
MAELLLLGPAILGGGCLAVSVLEPRLRSRVIVTLAAVGIVGGASLAWFARSGGWRTTALQDAPALAPAGLAVAGAWALIVVLDRGRGRWDAAALVGVASTGLVLFAANRWAVPGLLFWLCSSAAMVAMAAHIRGRAWIWTAALLSDGAIVAALATSFSLTETWTMPAPVAGAASLHLLAGAAIVRAGIVPRVGVWHTLESDAAPALPLLVGGSFVIVAGPAGRADPWIAFGVLALSAVVGATAARGERGQVSAAGAWFVALMLGAALAAPGAADSAGIAAVLAAVLIALWPHSHGRGRAVRGLVLAALPMTAGFAAVAAGAAAAFERAVLLAPNGSAPWALVAGTLPVVVGIGVVLGTRVATQHGPDTLEPFATIATWCVGAVSVAVGVTVFAEVLGSSPGATTLLVVAVLAGVASALVVARRASPPRVAIGTDFGLGLVGLGPRGDVALSGIAALLAALVVAGAAVLTVQGLRVGFL